VAIKKINQNFVTEKNEFDSIKSVVQNFIARCFHDLFSYSPGHILEAFCSLNEIHPDPEIEEKVTVHR
jgi:hypothetical protein